MKAFPEAFMKHSRFAALSSSLLDLSQGRGFWRVGLHNGQVDGEVARNDQLI